MSLTQNGIELTGTLDRVDLCHDSTLAVYDYKTGAIPSDDQQKHFDKQLLLSAALAEHDRAAKGKQTHVSQIGYIGLGRSPVFKPKDLTGTETQAALAELNQLLNAFQDPDMGYASRRAVMKRETDEDFDHLARYGEWDETMPPTKMKVGR